MEGILNYKTPDIGQSRTAVGAVNLCRDLSLINRKNHEHTTRKGVPLVYHTKVTVYRTPSTDVDEVQELQFRCVPKNWVYRNAAVKLHAAREAMMKKNGIKKSERGRYDHTIRYGWDNTNSSDGTSSGWLSPLDENYDLFSSNKLGTWDTTELFLSNGNEIRPTLWGGIADQLTDTHVAAAGNRSLAMMYLQSRNLIRQDDGDDTDIEGDGAESEFPSEFSVIKDLFNVFVDSADEVRSSVDTSQDNPPYDTDDITVTASFVEILEVGKSMCGLQSFVKDTLYLDIPFGIVDIKGIVNQSSSNRAIKFQIEVLGVSEMQG